MGFLGDFPVIAFIIEPKPDPPNPYGCVVTKATFPTVSFGNKANFDPPGDLLVGEALGDLLLFLGELPSSESFPESESFVLLSSFCVSPPKEIFIFNFCPESIEK